MQHCEVCGTVDEQYDEYSPADHKATPKHQFNKILYMYKIKKDLFKRNKEGIEVFCSVKNTEYEKSDIYKMRVYAKPKKDVNFIFNIANTSKQDMVIVGIGLAHPQEQFTLNNHGMDFGNETPYVLKSKSSTPETIDVRFSASDIGQFEMPIVFTFQKDKDSKSIIIIREMLIMVEDNPKEIKKYLNPFTNLDWKKANNFVPCLNYASNEEVFKIPKLLKTLFPVGLHEDALEKVYCSKEMKLQLRDVLITTRAIFDEGLTKPNYNLYWHHLLWWEEIVGKINLRKFNMGKVTLKQIGPFYLLEVPGLAEKRPSLLRGDKVYIRPCEDEDIIFESVVKNIENNVLHISCIDETFDEFYRPDATFSIRFIMSRTTMERMHISLNNLHKSGQICRVFPEGSKKMIKLQPIKKYYNKLIAKNNEQMLAVQHIVSKTSGLAPYMVFGPPGTGKTVTIVEAIIQLVLKDPKNKILVCTDSNMAADHIACSLIKYREQLQKEHITNFLFRANSQNRVWEVLPPVLGPVTNGTSYESFYSVSNYKLSKYRVVVTTLQHSFKYGSPRSQKAYKIEMTHLFIDEAAQAMEPACLIPITGLLAPHGKVILAGDTKQLGPVCISKDAKAKGLGVSLMERLINDYHSLYNDNNPKYITMLKKNFRSHPDILELPNRLFYENKLVPAADIDPLSSTNIFGEKNGNRALVFHSVNSKEQRIGKSPSFFNDMELMMVQRYIKQLIDIHKVLQTDIGVIAPYIRQVYKIKTWLTSQEYNFVEVGTVEAFQGKEKRVILVTTVRANSRLLDYDAKYGLGFLVDDKRFNVMLTRAKAKAIIIGNAICLERDYKWCQYMAKCVEYGTYYGKDTEQLKRTSQLLHDITKNRFNQFHINDYLKESKEVKE